jgi:hypothetical protein
MKVTEAPASQTTREPVETKRSGDAGDRFAFQRLLSDACRSVAGSGSEAAQMQSADPLAGPVALERIARTQAPEGCNVEEGITRIQSALDALERYREHLGDPRISLKEMMPVVRSLEGTLEDLKQLQGQDNLEPGLARVSSEAAVTAQVELLKFHRGDYL